MWIFIAIYVVYWIKLTFVKQCLHIMVLVALKVKRGIFVVLDVT